MSRKEATTSTAATLVTVSGICPAPDIEKRVGKERERERGII
jgi:hypothetical protein